MNRHIAWYTCSARIRGLAVWWWCLAEGRASGALEACLRRCAIQIHIYLLTLLLCCFGKCCCAFVTFRFTRDQPINVCYICSGCVYAACDWNAIQPCGPSDMTWFVWHTTLHVSRKTIFVAALLCLHESTEPTSHSWMKKTKQEVKVIWQKAPHGGGGAFPG